jgi:hypothetical protein
VTLAHSVKIEFDATYVDPLNARDYYVRLLIGYMAKWRESSKTYIAPYTSLVNASIMGKTQLAKEISTSIPTVYICARTPELAVNQGYPERSPTELTNYLVNIIYNATKSIEKNEELIEDHYIALFVSILHSLNGWALGLKSSSLCRQIQAFFCSQACSESGK